MARDRFAPRPLGNRPVDPFLNAEEAWMWFWQCQLAREEGARFVANAGRVGRPCDPDDVYRVAAGLHRARVLADRHLRVLARFGRRLAPPDGRVREERQDAGLWSEALEQLEEPLRAKGIVA